MSLILLRKKRFLEIFEVLSSNLSCLTLSLGVSCPGSESGSLKKWESLLNAFAMQDLNSPASHAMLVNDSEKQSRKKNKTPLNSLKLS